MNGERNQPQYDFPLVPEVPMDLDDTLNALQSKDSGEDICLSERFHELEAFLSWLDDEGYVVVLHLVWLEVSSVLE